MLIVYRIDAWMMQQRNLGGKTKLVLPVIN
jgi:hypothetical protein